MSAPSSNDLEAARAIVQRLLQGTGAKATLFGSRARGDPRQWSDIDLAVELPDTTPLTVLSELREAFEESNILLNVDVVDLHDASQTVRDAVMREGVPWIG